MTVATKKPIFEQLRKPTFRTIEPNIPKDVVKPVKIDVGRLPGQDRGVLGRKPSFEELRGKAYPTPIDEIEMKGIGLGPMWDEPGDERTMRERLGYGKPEVHEVFKAIREMVAPTTPYTEKEAIQAYKEIPHTLENIGARMLTLGGLAGPLMGLKPSELRAALNKDIEDQAGFAPALAPALSETTLLAVEWGYLYPKLFKLVGATGTQIAKIPQVAKGTKALKSLGGIEKVATKYPRTFNAATKGLAAFTKGTTVGAITATPEALGEELPAGEALKHISKQAALLGGVAASFQLASTVDTAIYTKRLRNILIKASNQRFSAKLREVDAMPKIYNPKIKQWVQDPKKTAAFQSLESLKKIELQNIDGIVSAAEAHLIGLKSGKMYQKGQEMVETPQKAAERFIKLGYLSTRPYPKGEASLKRGLGKPEPFIKMPTTRVGEAKEAIVESMKVAKHPIRAVRKATIPTEAPSVSIPKEPTPEKIVPVRPGLERIAEELPEVKAVKVPAKQVVKAEPTKVSKVMPEHEYAAPGIIKIDSDMGEIRVPEVNLTGKYGDDLETIFYFGNFQSEKVEQPNLKRSLSVGDTIKYRGHTLMIMPEGWRDITGLSDEAIDAIQTAENAIGLTSSWRQGEKRLNDWKQRFRKQAIKVAKAEKQGPVLTKEERELTWQELSRKRGYTESEIQDYQKRLDLIEEGKRLGLPEDEIFGLEDKWAQEALKEAPAEKVVPPKNVEGKEFTVAFYRPAVQGEIGPQTEYEKVKATSKTKAEQWAKSIAKEREWRYMAITEGEFTKKLTEIGEQPPAQVKPKEEPKAEPTKVGTIDNINVVGLADRFSERLRGLTEPIDNRKVKLWTAEELGVSETDLVPEKGYSHKRVQEAMELAVVRAARDIVEENRGKPDETFSKLQDLYARQPVLAARTGKTIERQAYSTPAPLAYVASELAGIDEKTIVWEPTAGTGMLTIGAEPKNVAVNEIDPTRAEILRSQGFLQVFEHDARKVSLSAIYDAVIMNPPFGKHKTVKYDGFKLSHIEHIIAAENLKAMKDSARAVIIVAAPKKQGKYSKPEWVFGNYLYSHYNVIGDFEVSGDLYARQGAAWPVRVIAIHGRKKSKKFGPKAGIFRAKSWEQVYNKMKEILADELEVTYPVAREKPPSFEALRRPVQRPAEKLPPVREPTEKPTEPTGERPARPGRPGKLPAERVPTGRGPSERPGRVPTGERPVQPEPTRITEPRVSPRKPKAEEKPAKERKERPTVPEVEREPKAPRVEKRKPVGVVGKPKLGKLQTPYKPASKAPLTNENIPTYLEPHVTVALNNLQKNVGDIDEYVREQLQYKSNEQMWEHLSASQVDSIALTLDRLDKGSALIVGHQTGVGKGRVAAAVVRRELLNGRKPVFFTAKKDLFSDFYRDLIDVGLTEEQLKPLMMNADIDIKDQQNRIVFDKHGNRANANTAIRKALRDKDYNLVLTTYSQINTETRHQRAQLAELVRGNVLILDESHNAAGESKTGDFIKEILIAHSSGVLFSSATYAKNPKTMMLYARTGLLDAFDGDVDNMLNAVQMGGEPYQEVIAAALARANCYIRTELDFSGVSYETTIDARHLERDTERSDKVTEVLRNIVSFDNAFSGKVIEPMQKQAKALAKRTRSVGTTIGHTNFAAVAHNAIKQMLLALKIDETIDMAKRSLKEGKRPIIALENTMGSFLDRYVEQHSLKIGDSIKDFDYRAVLFNMLRNVLKYREVSAYGDEEVIWVPVEELPLELQDAYHAIEKHIKDMELDLPGSPIDEIISRLEDEGYKVGEITGRDKRLIKVGENQYKLGIRSAAERNKTDIAYKFNNQDIQVLVVNVAGAEGMSIHASEKFKNKEQRQMIVAQAHADINKFVQVLGRINRKGQVVVPGYKILMTALPAEIRPAAILENKMRSLNANTSAKTKGAYQQKEVPDILNLYGDYIVAQYIVNNPGILVQVGLDVSVGDYQTALGTGLYHGPWHSDNIARKFTGRAALLTTEQQNEFYQWAEPEYTRLIEYLNKTDQNELVSTDKNYKAKEVKSKQIFVGEPGNVFQEPSFLDKMSVVMEGRPMTTEEIKDEIQEVVQKAGYETPSDYMTDMRKKLDAAWERYVEQKGEKNIKQASVNAYSRADSIMRWIKLGGIREDGEKNPIVILELIHNFDKEKFTINPAAPSNIQLRVAIPHPAKYVTISLSQYWSMSPFYGTADKYFNIPSDQKENRYIANGNIIAAMGVIVGDSEKRNTQIRPKVINYTMEDGSLRQGLLLPKNYDPNVDLPTSVNMIPEAAVAYLMDGYPGQRHLKIGEARIHKSGRAKWCYIEVPKSKARGLKYFGDAGLKKIVGEFETYRQAMRADFPSERLANALVYLKGKGNAIKSDDDDADTAREYNNAHRDIPESDEYGMAEVKKPTIKLKLTPTKPVIKPISSRDIVQYLSNAFGVPIRGVATFRKKRPGWYNKRTRGVRLKNVNSLRVACHEVGHHIDSYINNEAAKKMSHAWYGLGAELVKLGKALYGKKRPKAGYKAEGYAEFVFGWLTEGIDLKKEAPKMLRFFENDYLKDNPEIADILHTAKDMTNQWKEQGAKARFKAMIGQKLKPEKNWKERYSLWHQVAFSDISAPIQKALQENIPSRSLEFGSKDPGFLYTFLTQTEGARAKTFVMEKTIDLWGNKTGPSLKEVIKPVADRIEDFIIYITAARAVNLNARGIESGFDPEDALYNFKENDSAQWRKVAQDVTDWNHRVLDYLVQAGGLEAEGARRMRELNPIYIPFMRSFAPGEKRRRPSGVGRGLIKRGKGIYKLVGSGRPIEDPLDSMITQTRRLISIAHKSAIARALAQIEGKYPGLAGFIERVPPPTKALTFDASQLKNQLIQLGIDVEPGDLDDAMFTVFANSPVFLGKEHIISVVVDGKRKWYEIAPELYRVLEDLDQFQLPKVLNWTFGKLCRSTRLGATGIHASFGLIKNPIRDIMDTTVKARYAYGPVSFFKGLGKDLSRMGLAKSLGIDANKSAERFNDIGGKISGYMGQDRTAIHHLKGEMLSNTVGKYAIHTIAHPIEAMRAVMGVPESGLRIEEFEKALKDWMSKHQPQGGEPPPDAIVYAFCLASDQTINYRRAGLYGRWLNQMIAFWNANAQDISKVYRTFRDRPKPTMLRGLVFLTLPALGLWWLHRDEEWYKNVPSWERANYIHIPVYKKVKGIPILGRFVKKYGAGEDVDYVLRLPVPFLMGHIFQAFPTTVIDALYQVDPGKITDFLGEVYKADIKPLFEWPSALSPFMDLKENKDWAGRPIIPRGVEGKLPEDQYKEYTTEFCKVLGKIFNYPPANIEYVLNSWSGGLYRRTTGMAELLLGVKKEIQAAEWPLIGTLFVRDPYAPKAAVEKFYKEKEWLDRMYQSGRIAPGSDLDKKRKRYNSINTKFLSPRWKALIKTKTVKQREKIYKEIGALVK